jgi:integrase
MKNEQKELPRGVFEKVPGSGVYWIQYFDYSGKRRREKAGTLGNAKKLLVSRRNDKLEGKLPEPRKVTKRSSFSELIDAAKKSYAAESGNQKSIADMNCKLERIRGTLGQFPADQITPSQIRDWLKSEADEHEWKPASRNRYQSAISMVFRVAVDDGKLAKNPIAKLKKQKEDNQRDRFIDVNEERELLRVIRERYPYAPLVELSIHSGMRLSELLRAKVADYDQRTGKLTVHQRKAKNAPPVRHVPLDPIGVAAYQALAGNRAKGEPLCVQMENGKEVLTQVRYWFDPCVKAAGLVDFKWHDLRHTAASRWVMAGVPLAVVARYLGHANIQMTMRYSHLQPENDQRAMDAMMSYYNATATGTDGAAHSGNVSATRTATATSKVVPMKAKSNVTR